MGAAVSGVYGEESIVAKLGIMNFELGIKNLQSTRSSNHV